MNYIETIAARIGSLCEMSMEDSRESSLLRYYAVLCLIRGVDITNEDVHNAWAAWRSEDKPNHPSLIPYDKLTKEVQDLDTPYREAIKEVAKQIKLRELYYARLYPGKGDWGD